MTGRGGRLVALSACVGLVASCGLGEKQEHADAVIAAVERVVDAGSAAGTLSVSQAFVSAPTDVLGGVALPASGDGDAAEADAEPLPLPFPTTEPPPLVVDVVLDLDEGIASSTFSHAGHPYGVFDDMDLYARRFNAGERDARPWVHVKGDRLRKDSGGLASRDAVYLYAGFAINPIVLLDLAAAPLTGSIELVGTDVVAGVETTHYEANFDLEKMLTDTRGDSYPEERRDVIETLLDLLVIKGNTHSGEVWLDDDGFVRRFSVTLRQNPFADLEFDLTLTLELSEIGGPVTVTRPGPRELVSVGSVRQFLNAAVPPPDSEEFVRTVVGVASA